MLRVYTRSDAGDDLIMVGEMRATMKNGTSVSIEFCARAVIECLGSKNGPKVSLYQVWTASTLS